MDSGKAALPLSFLTVRFSDLLNRQRWEEALDSAAYVNAGYLGSCHSVRNMGVCMSKRVVDVRATSTGRLSTVEFGKQTGPLKKRESDMNILVPVDSHLYDHDESRFEREKVLLVLCPNADPKKPGKLMLFDIDYQSKNYCAVLSEMTFPTSEDEFMYAGWARSAAKVDEINALNRSQLIVPCFGSSRVYIVTISDNHSMSVSKCFESDTLLDRGLRNPISACSWPGRSGPVVLATCGDIHKRARGDLVVLNVNKQSILARPQSNSAYAVFGGCLTLHPSQKLIFTSEFGDPSKLMSAFAPEDEKHSVIQSHSYGSNLNIWDTDTIRLRQTIQLEEKQALGFSCIRFIHNPECNHGFACSIFGGSIFHIHRISKTEEYVADKVVQYPDAKVSGWLKQEMPPMPVDMVISMDDRFLYVACYLHGFIEQFNITDPFRVNSCARVFLGGAIQTSMGVRLQRISATDFEPRRCFLRNSEFDGGPARLQLSLDGHRLYVTNSYYTPWDTNLFPRLKENGSVIALLHITVSPSGGMKLDDNFAIRLSSDDDPKNIYLAREMRFLNGDSTSDFCD